MRKSLLVLFVGLFLFSACVPVQPATSVGPGLETIVAITMQALTDTAPTPVPPTQEPPGLPVSFNNISFTIPLVLNASATPATVTDVEFPYINPGADPMPEHVAFIFTNYPLSGDARIMVFRASDYAAYGPSLQDTVTALLAGEDANQTLPDALTTGDFFAQVGRVAFQNGHGVRFITEVLTGFAPINNRDIFYFYQGITNDGAYFVSAIFPVNAALLVADGNADSPTPADGVPFPWSGDINYPDYLSAVTEKLNNADPTVFSPPLADLDALIVSIRIVSQ